MDPLDRLMDTFSLEELEAERDRLNTVVNEHAQRLNRIDRLISLLREVGAEDFGVLEEESDDEPVAPKADPVGQRPSLDEAILTVMDEWVPSTLWRGDKVLIALERKGWAPGGRTPRNTVDATLSRLTKQGRLERAARGVYKLPSETSGGDGAVESTTAITDADLALGG